MASQPHMPSPKLMKLADAHRERIRKEMLPPKPPPPRPIRRPLRVHLVELEREIYPACGRVRPGDNSLKGQMSVDPLQVTCGRCKRTPLFQEVSRRVADANRTEDL
jgi:hypothetical protein